MENVKPKPFETASEAVACDVFKPRERLVSFLGGFLVRDGKALVDSNGKRFGVRVFCSAYDREAEQGRFHLRLVGLGKDDE